MMGFAATMIDARKRASRLLGAFRDDENGATAIEYSLLAGLLFLAIVSAVRAYTQTTNEMYQEINDTMAAQIE